MKRDWEIIRSVLLELEQAATPNTNLTPANLGHYPEQEVAYNMRLLEQAGFVRGKFLESKSGDGRIAAAIVTSMTNTGHELLDTIRSDTIWSKTKEAFKSKGLDMTFDLVLAVGKKIIESVLAG